MAIPRSLCICLAGFVIWGCDRDAIGMRNGVGDESACVGKRWLYIEVIVIDF